MMQKMSSMLQKNTFGAGLNKERAQRSVASIVKLAAVIDIEAPIAILWTCLYNFYWTVKYVFDKQNHKR